MKKNITILGIAIVIIIAIFGIKNTLDLRQTQQGNLNFYVMDNKDIKDEKVKAWYLKNYQEKGIHSVTSGESRYILLSSGQQDVNMKIKVKSIIGKEKKIKIDGTVEVPNQNIEQGLSYPNVVLRIKKDPREIVLGSLNLYNPMKIKPTVVSMDTAIIKEIRNENISVATFKNEYKNNMYLLSEDVKEKIKKGDFKQGDVVGVKINNSSKNPYPTITYINQAKSLVESAQVKKIDKTSKMIEIFVNGERFQYKYEIDDKKLENVPEESFQMLVFEKKDGATYIKDIIS